MDFSFHSKHLNASLQKVEVTTDDGSFPISGDTERVSPPVHDVHSSVFCHEKSECLQAGEVFSTCFKHRVTCVFLPLVHRSEAETSEMNNSKLAVCLDATGGNACSFFPDCSVDSVHTALCQVHKLIFPSHKEIPPWACNILQHLMFKTLSNCCCISSLSESCYLCFPPCPLPSLLLPFPTAEPCKTS